MIEALWPVGEQFLDFPSESTLTRSSLCSGQRRAEELI